MRPNIGVLRNDQKPSRYQFWKVPRHCKAVEDLTLNVDRPMMKWDCKWVPFLRRRMTGPQNQVPGSLKNEFEPRLN